jgi:UDP-N-acetylglucosamine pyrophosphorylase
MYTQYLLITYCLYTCDRSDLNRGGRPCIVEYSEMTAENTAAVDSSTGKLLYGAGNICNHYYTLQFVQQVAVPALAQGGSVAYHVAHKQVTRHTHCTCSNGTLLCVFAY